MSAFTTSAPFKASSIRFRYVFVNTIFKLKSKDVIKYTPLAFAESTFRVITRTSNASDWRRKRATLPPCFPVPPVMAISFLLDMLLTMERMSRKPVCDERPLYRL